MSAAALIVVLLLAQASPDGGLSDGGAGDTVAVHKAVIDEQLPDGGVGRRLVVVGGCWLSDAYCVGYAGELADLRRQNGWWAIHGADVQYLWVVGAGVTSAAIGAVAVKVWDDNHPR